jgi:hypothetical protein
VGLLGTLKKVLDPRGPLGNVVSPSEVFKERAGLPITAPHTERVRLAAPAHVEQALAPSRFISASEAVDVPRDRVRQVSAFVEERWTPIYATTDSTDIATIILTAQTQIGWQVTQRQSQSSRVKQPLSAEEFVEVLQSAQIQASDEFLNDYYETIPGNDIIEIDGKKLTGGTRITGGRREYEAKTKNMVHWDKGFVKQRLAAQAEMESRPVRNIKANLERVAGDVLPMRRLIANPRYDRKSHC